MAESKKEQKLDIVYEVPGVDMVVTTEVSAKGNPYQALYLRINGEYLRIGFMEDKIENYLLKKHLISF